MRSFEVDLLRRRIIDSYWEQETCSRWYLAAIYKDSQLLYPHTSHCVQPLCRGTSNASPIVYAEGLGGGCSAFSTMPRRFKSLP
jgi:hypothetical protein